MSNKQKVELKLEVTKETKDYLDELSKKACYPCGDVIERLVGDVAPSADPYTAAELILDDIIKHTLNLNESDCEKALLCVLDVIEFYWHLKERATLADSADELKKFIHKKRSGTL